MGKRINALRVALALPKRTNWKRMYSDLLWDTENKHSEDLAKLGEVVAGLRERVKKLTLQHDKSLLELEVYKQAESDRKKLKDPFRFKPDREIVFPNPTSHAFQTGYRGNAWRCVSCGTGTRDPRHDEHRSTNTRTHAREEGGVNTSTPEERRTDGYYISERSLKYSQHNSARRRAYVHAFACPRITSRRPDKTIIVKSDGDPTVAHWIWGADMQEIRAIAAAHNKYTKRCNRCMGVEHSA